MVEHSAFNRPAPGSSPGRPISENHSKERKKKMTYPFVVKSTELSRSLLLLRWGFEFVGSSWNSLRITELLPL